MKEYVKGGNPDVSNEEICVAIKNYWRNIRRQNNERDKWERRQLEARRRKSKRDKCQCRIQGVPHSSLSEMDKKTMANALQVLPVEVTMSTEESGEEDNPFNQGEQMAVKVERQIRAHHRPSVWWEEVVLHESFSDEQWSETFRVIRATFDQLVERTGGHGAVTNTCPYTCALQKRVGIALYKLLGLLIRQDCAQQNECPPQRELG
ncbi:UNVERIFIED_CONTAM: hypothetical protein FKN15_063860 [Acipenser sinensis]